MLVESTQLQPGNILDQDVVMPSGRTLMSTGMVLTQSMIDLIVKRNFDSIEVNESSFKSNAIVDKVFTQDILVNKTMKNFKSYVESRKDYYELINNR